MIRRRMALATTVTILVVAAFVSGILLLTRDQRPLLPVSITNQVSFVIYVPGKDWQTSALAPSYVAGVLTLHGSQVDINVTMTEQATPDVFTDVPSYYPTLVTKLKEYVSFGTTNGTVYLTTPAELKGQQQAVLNNDGTLLFAHPTKNLSQSDWRRFFNEVRTVTP